GGIVDHMHQTGFAGPLFQPAMKAPVQLHQFAEVSLPLPPLAIGLALPPPAPQACFPHPTPQALGRNLQPVASGQMLGSQRGTEIRIALSPPSQHRLPKLRRVRPIRPPPAVRMLQSLGPPPR